MGVKGAIGPNDSPDIDNRGTFGSWRYASYAISLRKCFRRAALRAAFFAARGGPFSFTLTDAVRTGALRPLLLLHPSSQVHFADEAPIDIALVVHPDAFRRSDLG